MGVVCIIFSFGEGFSNSHIALNINNILYYHLDVCRLTMLGHSYCVSLEYLDIQRWVRATLLSPTSTIQVGLKIYRYIKFFLRVVRYLPTGVYVVPSHHIVAVLDVTNHFSVTAFQIPSFQICLLLVSITKYCYLLQFSIITQQ